MVSSSNLSDQTLHHHPDALMTPRQRLSDLCLQRARHPAGSKDTTVPKEQWMAPRSSTVRAPCGATGFGPNSHSHWRNICGSLVSGSLPTLQALAPHADLAEGVQPLGGIRGWLQRRGEGLAPGHEAKRIKMLVHCLCCLCSTGTGPRHPGERAERECTTTGLFPPSQDGVEELCRRRQVLALENCTGP